MIGRRLRRLIPEPVKRVLRPMAARFRRVARPGAVTAAPSPSKGKGGRLAADLAHARRRIAMLKRRTGSDERRWSRQLDSLVPRRVSRLTDLAFFPAGNWNAYMRLLYSRCPEFGFRPRPLQRIREVDDLPPTAVLHLHWTRAAQVGTSTAAEAEKRSAAFLDPIERFVARGGVLVWTIHEALAHDCPFPDVEIQMRRRLAELAHGIHVLHPSAVETVRPLYPLDPAKVFVVEHPLYSGAYEDHVTRGAARATLDLPEEAVLLLAFGAIRPYKGFDRLVGLLPAIRSQTGRDVRVMIAGRTLEADDSSALRELVGRTAGATMTEDGPPDRVVQILFRAADILVLPYRELHNSGVLLLGLTFGVPTVVPRTPLSLDMSASGLVTFFETGSDDDLARAVVDAIRAQPASQTLPSAFAEQYHPARVSRVFCEQLGEVVARARRR